MSFTLNLRNFPEANTVEKTNLSADIAAAATAISFKNTQGFVADDYLIIGTLGSEKAELRQLTSVNADQVQAVLTAAVKFAHDKFDDVTKIYGNQMKIYRASNVDGSIPADGSFTALTTIDIDPDQVSTRYEDTSGSSDYWYKRTFYNETSTDESPLAEASAYRGGDYPEYASLEDIREKAGLQNNRWISAKKIDDKRRAAQSIIDARLTGLYTVPFTPPVNQLINEITQLYAAGLLLTSEATTAAARAQGQALIDEVTNNDGTGLLDRIDKKELKLVGLTGDDQTAAAATGFSAWPNADTATETAENGGAERGFRISDRY